MKKILFIEDDQYKMEKIKTFLEKEHTPVHVREAIYSGLHNWLQPDDALAQEETDYGNANEAMRQQCQLGWRHFIRGRMSMEWGQCIYAHIQQKEIKGITEEQWGATILSINWKHILKIWKSRNGTEHGSTAEEQEEITCKNIISEIENIFFSNNGVLHCSVAEWNLENLREMTSAFDFQS